MPWEEYPLANPSRPASSSINWGEVGLSGLLSAGIAAGASLLTGGLAALPIIGWGALGVTSSLLGQTVSKYLIDKLHVDRDTAQLIGDASSLAFDFIVPSKLVARGVAAVARRSGVVRKAVERILERDAMIAAYDELASQLAINPTDAAITNKIFEFAESLPAKDVSRRIGEVAFAGTGKGPRLLPPKLWQLTASAEGILRTLGVPGEVLLNRIRLAVSDYRRLISSEPSIMAKEWLQRWTKGLNDFGVKFDDIDRRIAAFIRDSRRPSEWLGKEVFGRPVTEAHVRASEELTDIFKKFTPHMRELGYGVRDVETYWPEQIAEEFFNPEAAFTDRTAALFHQRLQTFTQQGFDNTTAVRLTLLWNRLENTLDAESLAEFIARRSVKPTSKKFKSEMARELAKIADSVGAKIDDYTIQAFKQAAESGTLNPAEFFIHNIVLQQRDPKTLANQLGKVLFGESASAPFLRQRAGVIPHTVRDYDPARVLPRYISDMSRALALQKAFGRRPEVTFSVLARAAARNAGPNSQAIGDYLNRLWQGIVKSEYGLTKSTVQVLQDARALTASVKLLYSWIPNLAQNTLTYVTTSARSFTKALAKAWTAEGREFVRRTGLYTADAIDEILEQAASIVERGSKIARHPILKAARTPFTFTEQTVNRRLAEMAGREEFRSILQRVKRGERLTPGEVLHLNRLGFTVEQLRQARDPKFLERLYALRSERLAHFGSSILDVPTSWKTPLGAFFSQFKHFAFGQSKFFRNALIHATQAMAAGDPKPFSKLLTLSGLLPTTGFIVRYLYNLLYNRDKPLSDNTIANIIDAASYAGGLGIALDILLSAATSDYIPGQWLLEPAALSTAFDLLSGVSGEVRKAVKGEEWSIPKALRAIPIAKSIYSYTNQPIPPMIRKMLPRLTKPESVTPKSLLSNQ